MNDTIIYPQIYDQKAEPIDAEFSLFSLRSLHLRGLLLEENLYAS